MLQLYVTSATIMCDAEFTKINRFGQRLFWSDERVAFGIMCLTDYD